MNTSLQNYEECSLCGELTGRSGKHEDSIYLAINTPAQIGPLCMTCFQTICCDIIGEDYYKNDH